MIRVALDAGHWEIWSEPEASDVAVGRCIGAGDTLEQARSEAYLELNNDHAQVEKLSEDMPVCWDCGTPLHLDAEGKAEKPCGHLGVLVVPAAHWLSVQATKERAKRKL